MNCVVLTFISFLLVLCSIFVCHGIQVDDFTDVCISKRDDFAVAASKFTLCSINYSRPITLCENCVDSYLNVVNSYRNMSETVYDGTTCLARFVNLDRLQIVETQYLNSVNLWNRGKCNECFSTENGVQLSDKSNQTKQFLEYYKTYEDCVKNNNADSKELCANCMNFYVTLNDYYLSISNSNEKISLCIDLVDLMNSTWAFWSDNCCKYRRHNEYIFICSTVGVFLLTILFYIVIQICAEKRVPTIIQQTRFAESVNSFRN